MTRLSANARPFTKTATYAHQARPRVSFGGITACRRFQVTPEERSARLWAWHKGGAEGVPARRSGRRIWSLITPPYPSKIKPQDAAAAAPFEVPPEPMPVDLHKRLTWRGTQDTLVRQKTKAYELNLRKHKYWSEGDEILAEIYSKVTALEQVTSPGTVEAQEVAGAKGTKQQQAAAAAKAKRNAKKLARENREASSLASEAAAVYRVATEIYSNVITHQEDDGCDKLYD